MRKLVIAVVLTLVLSLALAGPVLADPADPDANDWGQAVSSSTPRGDHAKVGQGGLQGGRPWGEAGMNIKFHGG